MIWASLGLVVLAAASAVSYYQIERERRFENAMGKIVSGDGFWIGLDEACYNKIIWCGCNDV